MNELLIELKERLNQIAITGLKLVSEDFRLKKLYDKLNALSKKSSVLAKISELMSQLIEGNKNNAYIIYSELVNLTNAVLYTQGISSLNEKETDIELLDNKENIAAITYSQIDNIRDILERISGTVWDKLKNFYDEKILIDYRLLDDFLDQLSSPYVYEENFSIVTILSAYGESIIPLLLKKFDTVDATEKCNIIKIISQVGKAKYNDYYIKWIGEEYKDIVTATAIGALKYDKNNENYLLNMKVKKKKLQQARISALAYMENEIAHEEVKNYCIKNTELLEPLFEQTHFLSEQEVIYLIRKCVNELKKGEVSDKSKQNIFNNMDLLKALINCAKYFNSNDITDTLIYIEESNSFKDKNWSYAVWALLSCKDEYSQKYLVSIKDRFNQNYIEASFIASLRMCTKEEVFDNFSCFCIKKSTHENKINNLIKCCFEERHNYYDCNYDYTYFIDDDLKKSLEWDSRWADFTIENNLIELSKYFIPSKLDNIMNNKFKRFYLNYLDNIKAKYKTITVEKRHDVINAMLGLYKIGAKQEAEDNIKYFAKYSGFHWEYKLNEYLTYSQYNLLKTSI